MIRVGLIGYGYWGPKLARCLAREAGCELRAICDLSSDALVATAKDHPCSAIERDWRKLIADPALDAIVIATPAGEHFVQASAALEAGKHVLVEKPMALSSETALAMIESARRRHLVLLVDHTYVYSPAVREIQSALAQGALGHIREYSSQRYNAAGSRRDADVLWDLAAHDIAILEFLFPGAAQAVRVTETGGTTSGSPSRAALCVHCDNELVARIRVDWAAGQKRRRIEIAGTKAGVVFDDLQSPKLWWADKSNGTGPATPSAVSLHENEPLALVIRHFLSSIHRKEGSLAAGWAAMRVVELLEAASESLARGGSLVRMGIQGRVFATAAR